MNRLLLTHADQIVAAAIAQARGSGYRPMAVAVLDDAGHIKAVVREDGASMARVDIAVGKAWAAVSLGASSRALSQRARENPSFFGALAVTHGGKFIPQTGAVLICDPDGATLGAVGASGGSGDEDELVCIAGVAAAGLRHE